MTFEELKQLATAEGLKFFVAPDRPAVMMGMRGLYGSYQIVVPLELDGRFLQFRTIGYLSCPADHPHIDAVLRLLGQLDYELRLTKFGWDPSDGEIAAYADVWLEDATLTQQQFSGILHLFIPGIDVNHKRITETIETGTDPGEIRPEDMVDAASRLPAKLRELLEKLARGEKVEEPGGPVEI